MLFSRQSFFPVLTESHMPAPIVEAFKTVGLIGKFATPSSSEPVCAVAALLEKRGIEVMIDNSCEALTNTCSMYACHSRDDLARLCDLVIVVGGDGTLLNAARSLAGRGVPLLGINLGRLGFLTDISPDHMEETLSRVLDGQFFEEKRFLLQASLIRDGEVISTNEAFNDVVVHKWNVARMLESQVAIDGLFVYSMRSDGLIVSTPTGSTAYALSGGGPILHPGLDALVLVPICPHTMTNRPLVVNGNSKIEITVCANMQDQAQVTCDGQLNLALIPGDKVRVQKKDAIHLIHPSDHDYYHILREKLHWGKQLT
jgi:NAD+ kinase